MIFSSCTKKFFADKELIIGKTKGIAVFVNKESRNDRNSSNGHLFVDSLIPDFFIPYKFSKNTINKEEIDKAILSNDSHNVSFFYLIRDCNEAERSAAIKFDCIPLLLDKNIDDYLHSNKIFVQPVEIHFIKANIDREYYTLRKNLDIFYQGKVIKLLFQNGSYDILSMDLLECNWK